MVRKVYEDMSMCEIPTWFDIWGSMQGNTNDAMAIGLFGEEKICISIIYFFLFRSCRMF